jgi:CubicO group peptidase (beta-lactamase class C family)
MQAWLPAALDYVPRWIEFQMRAQEQPGCVIAISHRGKIVLEQAFGHADVARGVPLTPRHRFRIASHSKSFTAAGVMKLREQGRLRLDDPVGQHVRGLHAAVGRSTVAQLLSHGAGLVRDGADGGQWADRRPFLSERELRKDLAAPPVIEPSSRFKYSNHGYALLGLLIESVTSESYRSWMQREIVEAAGLDHTEPDMPLTRRAPVARGHGGKLPLGRRVTIPGDNPTNALAAATGFVSTARDLVLFFAQLAPKAKPSVLSAASRREMVRRLWRDPHSSVERHYGLGIMSGSVDGWDWLGHSGGLQGFITRTCTLPQHELTISVLTNAIDGLANAWVEGIIHVLRTVARHGPPSRRVRDWTGRWWSPWGVADLVPAGKRVLVANPALAKPFMDASELEVIRRDRARIALAGGFASHGEPVRRVRGRSGKVVAVWLAASEMLPEKGFMAEIDRRYPRSKR